MRFGESILMKSFTIDLEPEEEELAGQIEFDALTLEDHQHWKRNSELAACLAQSLLDRKGIPPHRLRYFTDPDYFTGKGKGSHLDQFRKHGVEDAELLRHPHFLKYLRYFIYGANLPDKVRNAFKARVDSFGGVTSGDIPELGHALRSLVRQFSMKPAEVSEEFFQLALDCGLDPYTAGFVRKTVTTVR